MTRDASGYIRKGTPPRVYYLYFILRTIRVQVVRNGDVPVNT